MAYNNTYQISGEIALNTITTPQTDILSDIRSIEGITIVTFTPKNDEESAASNRNHIGILNIKFDTFPFTEFDKDTQINILVDQIRRMPAVNYFKPGQINILETRLKSLVKEILSEKKTKRDRCLRIADRKFDKPSAYKSGAVVRCRQGKIWKGVKEGLEDTFWMGNDNKKITLQQLLDVIKGYPIIQAPIEKVEKIVIKKDSGGIESDRLSAADIKYPIIIVIDDSGNYKYILDGNHRANKAIASGVKSIPAKLVNIKKLPQEFQDVLSEVMGLNAPWLNEILTEKQKETLRTWFKRRGAPGGTGGWVDCNSPIRKDGEIVGYKPCGRQKGEERAKYPSCRPTPSKCKDPGKGKTWGKTK